jgi:hypothetical protein
VAPSKSAQQQERRDAPRYKEAAQAALEQLDWVIAYLRRIRKPSIARALQANRDTIRKQRGL